MVMLTTLVTPPLLKAVFVRSYDNPRWPSSTPITENDSG